MEKYYLVTVNNDPSNTFYSGDDLEDATKDFNLLELGEKMFVSFGDVVERVDLLSYDLGSDDLIMLETEELVCAKSSKLEDFNLLDIVEYEDGLWSVTDNDCGDKLQIESAETSDYILVHPADVIIAYHHNDED